MATNPIKSLLPTDSEGARLGTELRATLENQKAAADSLKAPAAPMQKPVAAPARPSPVDKTNSQGPYGTGPGEKPPSQVLKGIMHKGGTVPETGAYLMKAKEHVLTPEKHQKLKAAMGLANDALSNEAEEPQVPKKVVKEMKIRRSANKGHIVTHVHAHFEHPDEEHTTQGADGLLNHVMQHMTDPNDGEEAAEAGNAQMPDSKGAAAIEQAIGAKK